MKEMTIHIQKEPRKISDFREELVLEFELGSNKTYKDTSQKLVLSVLRSISERIWNVAIIAGGCKNVKSNANQEIRNRRRCISSPNKTDETTVYARNGEINVLPIYGVRCGSCNGYIYRRFGEWRCWTSAYTH
ncbi:hypothetical protein RB195_008457 [Necator americanus]|uniref:Uncharacterized protein n=1 Tax=Necator americanus TaxID=51031 RepID=A0ABR1CRE2_NECAM